MPRKTKRAAADTPEVPMRRNCGTMAVHERLLQTVPGYRELRNASENQALRAAFAPEALRTGCTKIPVVVHVVYNTNAQNISDAQVKSQIDVLNADFRKKNADVSSIPAPFAALAADARIEFELATTDPAGNATNGITRTRTTQTRFLSDDSIKSSASGGANAWPADKYLNIWCSPPLFSTSGLSLLGYAQFPGGPPATDGVVVLHSAFGNTGTATAPFNLGRTTTHEVGHWLNLRHIWGDDGNGCSGDDFVTDTPNQGSENVGKPTFPHISCGNAPNGDMFMNYMDYVDDDTMFMFTAGQVTRMQATLDGLRSSIGTSISCGEVEKNPLKDLGKEIGKDIKKEPIKDLPKDQLKDKFKEPVKERPKEFAKEPIKEFAKEPPKDPPKDNPKDIIKEPIKDNPKEFNKDFPKDTPKDNPKELGKEGIKEFNKEFEKDIPKEFNKDGIKEFGKDIGEGKGILENPTNIPTNLPNVQPQLGNVPFVLATGAQGAAPGRSNAAQQAGMLANAYVQLLSQYARLQAAGLLDAASIAAWQEAAAAYQQLVAAAGQL